MDKWASKHPRLYKSRSQPLSSPAAIAIQPPPLPLLPSAFSFTMAQSQRNCQPLGANNNALNLEGGFPPLDGGPPFSASSTTSNPPPTPALLDYMTTASAISHSIKRGRLSVYPFLVRLEITKKFAHRIYADDTRSRKGDPGIGFAL